MAEKMDFTKVMCHICKKYVTVTEIKYVIDKKPDKVIPLCKACQKTHKTAEDGKKSYMCGRCNYKFKFRPDNVTKLKCPYCGKSDQVCSDKPIDMDSFIKDI
jgi:rubrerythrin